MPRKRQRELRPDIHSRQGVFAGRFPEEPDMADAFVIEFQDFTAGLAVRERGGFRFFASDTRFRALDEHKFRRVSEIHHRIEDVVRKTSSAKPRLAARLPVPTSLIFGDEVSDFDAFDHGGPFWENDALDEG
jgi:hypothetical protein